SHLLPRRSRLLVLADEVDQESVEFRGLRPLACPAAPLGQEVTDVQEDHAEVVERFEGSHLHREPPIAVRRQATLHLDTNAGQTSVYPDGYRSGRSLRCSAAPRKRRCMPLLDSSLRWCISLSLACAHGEARPNVFLGALG